MGHKILLADDSITIQKVIELTFSDEDFELHTVGNGQKAIDEIRTIQPDIVLCDIIMPEKNGYEVCEFIKSTDELKHIPVLLLTGAFEPFDQERAKAAGCEGFLAKPFEPQTLISKVKELLAGASGAPAAAPAALPTQPMPASEPMAPAPMPPDPMSPPAAPAPMEMGVDETVMMPPAMDPPPVQSGPQVPMAPTPPPMDGSPGLGDDFAVEAGERELAMEAGDHTMLLGANEAIDVPAPPGTPPGASDDIWNDVSSTPPAPPAAPSPMEPEDDGATVFVAGPPIAENPDLGPVDNEMSVGNEDPDATWQMPPSSPDAPQSAPPTPPAGDLGGFEDFAAPVEPPAPAPAPPPLQPEPSAPSLSNDPPADPFAPEPPSLGSTNEVAPVPMTPEPIPSVDTEATIDPVIAGGEPVAPLGASPEPPQIAPEIPTASEPETPFTPVDAPAEMPSIEATPAPPPLDAPPVLNAPPMEAPPVMDASPPAREPEPAPEPMAPPPMDPMMEAAMETPVSAAQPGVSASGTDDDLVERVAQRVVDKLSSKIIQEIAWEVVPDLAEGLIQKEIEVLKSKIPKQG